MLYEYDTFLYELTVYKIYKKDNRVELIYSKYYKSDKLFQDKSIVDYHPNKKKAEIVYTKIFTLVGASKDYIEHYYIEHLPKTKTKKKNEKRNSTVRHRKV